eukprot:TRINITY_DN954_c1_g2_i3.p1 TRINITY_DN954_c1_g2~~TRINITY_DN954_c1_g2_i3.p1  ORF type:complete len:191 (+),score=79.02 TRINITY_DN954_c1_g2_i3:336-908(+)
MTDKLSTPVPVRGVDLSGMKSPPPPPPPPSTKSSHSAYLAMAVQEVDGTWMTKGEQEGKIGFDFWERQREEWLSKATTSKSRSEEDGEREEVKEEEEEEEEEEKKGKKGTQAENKKEEREEEESGEDGGKKETGTMQPLAKEPLRKKAIDIPRLCNIIMRNYERALPQTMNLADMVGFLQELWEAEGVFD